ncbi:GNAT family N-acetyltransferase [Lutibacter flavus]|uniref:Ribosomal-protein-alanine N-acetyltransferase n=1 Tax=Lutibacter flavus TaxID=691689 RepID=A0A238VMB9_9FLAO|nr:GNAT family N-acetyltransferase [Lutibacter flavus]SNR34883.1 ribosomal-protein-alanine N-acetyltransferase [Lutibacter flavus]
MHYLNFTPFPKLKSERLQLRQLNKSDAPIIFFLRSDAEVNKYIKRPTPKSIDDALAFIAKINNGIKENEWVYWCITLKDNPKVIGTISLWHFSKDKTIAEVGYDLHPDYQQKGIMNEALNTVLNYGFNTLNLREIEAFTHRNNNPSKKLLVNNKFIYKEDRKDEDNLDNHIFTVQNPNNKSK